MTETETVESMMNNLAIDKAVPAVQEEALSVQEKYDRMEQWLTEGGSQFPKLTLECYSVTDHRGMHASEHIRNDEVIISIPYKFIMTTERAKDCVTCKKLSAKGYMMNSKHSYLAVYLLEEKEKKEGSFYFPYIDMLPKEYANMPINFTEEEKTWLKGSFSLDKMALQRESLEFEYENICKNVPEFSRFSLKEFIWARHVVITRIFGITVHGINTEGLVPIADLLNHKRPRQTKWCYDTSRGAFTITSLQTFEKGEQVYDSYGRKCNHRFFVNYGFSLEENRDDNEVVLKLFIPLSDPLYAKKVKLLGYNCAPSGERQFQIPANMDDQKCKELMSFARFAAASESELKRFDNQYGFNVFEVTPISIRNEVAALALVKHSALLCLSEFDTTIEEDNELLSKPELLTNNIRNAILMRRGEKEVARFFVKLADSCIPILALSWFDFQTFMVTSPLMEDEFIAPYIKNVLRPLVRFN